MSYKTLSPLWSPNRNSGGNGRRGIVVHHAATTSFEAIGRTFQNTSLQTSAHYGVRPGAVQQYVREGDIAWHAGNWWANSNTIGIECVNSSGAPGWGVAEGTVDTLVELMADIARRNGMGKLAVGKNVWGHRDFSATMCPGVLYPRLGEICRRANKILEGGSGVGRWVKDTAKKKWWWKEADGSYPKSQWKKINGKWYWFDKDGWMATGFITYKGDTYYLRDNVEWTAGSYGSMATGWELVDGKWRYCIPDGDASRVGRLAKSCVLKISGKWYAFGKDGAMKEGMVAVGKTGALVL